MVCVSTPRGFLALLLLAGLSPVGGTGMRLNQNPIRRVVTMLQMMQKKIASEAKVEEELFDKFMCYCKSGVGSLVTSVKEAEQKIAQLESGIEETDSVTKQLVADTKKATADREEATQTLAKAKAIREKEQASFAKASAEAKTNIAAMGKAIQSLTKGSSAAFLQTFAAAELKKLSISMDISETDRDILASFLSGGSQSSQDSQDEEDISAANPAEVVGILKQMQKTMSEALAEAVASEQAAANDYVALTGAKEKQVSTLTKEIESKMVRSGEKGVSLSGMQEDLADTKKNLASDKKFLIDVTKDCQTKQAEKEANDKMRADENLALADTIKILNDDDALDLFKKTLPRASFLQMGVTSKALKEKALQVLKHGHRGKRDFRLNLIALALRGKKTSFDKVIKMVDSMVALLKKEQTSDDQKKVYCGKNLDETEDELKDLQSDIKDLDKAVAEHKESVKTMKDEIQALTTGINDLDKQVAEATKQRKEEHAEYEESMASDGAAKELLGMAKNRLAQFYTPKLAKPDPKRQLSEEEQITVNMGGTLAPTAAPGGIAGTGVVAAFAQYEDEAKDEDSLGFLQVRSHSKRRFKTGAAPPPPPETAGAYKKAGESSNGVMTMLDVLLNDLTKGMTENEANENEAQKEYEQFITDSAAKRAGDSKSISDKEGTKVELEANTLKMEQDRKGKMTESMAKMEALQGLHQECDWLVQNFDVRKKARTSEVENLNNAKAVLSGADFSF